ncbi:hypothetical protein [Streptomyces alanosinicus]|uniref:hypothetical protein n=1 Tax=Streptomyces alanosinicus TaxID=68171 RepID=UPI003570BD11
MTNTWHTAQKHTQKHTAATASEAATTTPARTAVLVAATITMGLSAGVFSIFACAVMPALARSDDRTGRPCRRTPWSSSSRWRSASR